MASFILLVVLAVIVLLLVKSAVDAQRARSGGAVLSRPVSRRTAPARPKPRRPPKPIDEARLADHVTKLRSAVDQGLITVDEAVASLVRQTEGQLSDDAARRLLQGDSAA